MLMFGQTGLAVGALPANVNCFSVPNTLVLEIRKTIAVKGVIYRPDKGELFHRCKSVCWNPGIGRGGV